MKTPIAPPIVVEKNGYLPGERAHPAVHSYPINDLRPHVLDGRGCWCRPEIDEDEVTFINHRALDQRDGYMSGLRKKH